MHNRNTNNQACVFLHMYWIQILSPDLGVCKQTVVEKCQAVIEPCHSLSFVCLFICLTSLAF